MRTTVRDLGAILRPPGSGLASRRAMARSIWDLRPRPSSRHDSTEKEAMILGHPMRYRRRWHLHYLFDEIFLDEQYAFAHGDDAPRIIDAGANIGMATLWFRMRYPNARITCIEPDPLTFELLRANIERNGFAGVDAIQAALAAKAGECTFFIDPAEPADGKQSVDPLRIDGTAITVPAITLSSLIDGPVDLLKIDVEGAEHEVMAEIEATGALAQVRAITMEYHHHIDPDVDRLSEMLALLERSGFAYRIWAKPLGDPLDRASVTRVQDIAVLAIRRTAA